MKKRCVLVLVHSAPHTEYTCQASTDRFDKNQSILCIAAKILVPHHLTIGTKGRQKLQAKAALDKQVLEHIALPLSPAT